MNILLNYLPVYKGGGLQNAINFWSTCLKSDKSNNWICITRSGSEIIELGQDPNHIIVEVKLIRNYLIRFIQDYIILKKNAKKYKADILFTLVGPGSSLKGYKKVNGWHEPGYVYPESDYWNRISFFSKLSQKLKYKYSDYILKRADYICVQTETMRCRMIRIKNIPESKLRIVPNGITSFSESNEISTSNIELIDKYESKIKLLVLSEPWPHKNFEYIFDLSKTINDKFIFIISFDKETSETTRKFIDKVDKEKLSHKFEFIGRIKHNQIKALYSKIDAVFLPTLLESFSANYVEAMYYKKPIFTSNLDFAIEVCSNYAFYFDPFNTDSAKKILYDYYINKTIQFKTLDNYITYPDWNKRFNIYLNVLKEAYNKK